MKRAAILILCAFYILLSSGMYVCAVHCSIEKLVAKPSAQMACTKPCCKQSASCGQQDCAKKHGSFTISENVKPGYQVSFNLLLLTLQPVILPGYQSNTVLFIHNISLANSKAWPDIYGRALTIQFRSLLI
jgi:hypothetical protein